MYQWHGGCLIMSLVLIWAVRGTVTDGRRMLATFTTIARDVRGAFRHATRRPLYAAAVIGTLTLGIAATTVAYGLATAVLWRPLPFRDVDRLVFVWEASERDGRQEMFRVTRMAAPAAADPHGGAVTPIREQFVRDARLPLLALTGAAVAFLLVACANLAALQISAFESRRAEIAIRAALGATAGRLAGQLTVEAMILALVAGATGMLVADYVLAALPERLPPSLPFLTSAVLDFRVAIVATLTAIGSGLLIAAWPVGQLLRSGPTPRGVAPGTRGAGANSEVRGQAQVRIVSASYFDALDVAVVSGRTFSDEDGLGRPGVAVVNEAFVREHGATALGRRLRSAAPQGTWGATAPRLFEIVGVVENERFRGLESPSEAAVYLSTRQFPQTGFTLK